MLVAVSALVGLLIGSFLNVVVWRLPRGESLSHPPSHCPRCETPIAPRDNVPVLSWLLLRGRCRHCGEPISARYPLVEAATAVLFAVLAARIGPHPAVVGFLWLGAAGLALALIDLDVRRLPDKLTYPSYAVGLVSLGIAAGIAHHAWPFERAVIGMAALFGLYAVVWFVYPGGMGLGDVKLAGVLGLFLGWLGWDALAVGAFAAFLLGGVAGVAVIAAGRGGRKTALPFGPFMLVGALVGILAGHAIGHAYLQLGGA